MPASIVPRRLERRIPRVARNDSPCLSFALLQVPLDENLVDRTVGVELGERGVDLLEKLLIGLAHADAHAARHLRLVGRDELRLEVRILGELVLEDRRIAEAGL